MKLINKTYTKILKRPLKKSKTGMETEFHIINEKGKISNNAEKIISDLKKYDKSIEVVKEVGKNLIEFGCYPDVATYNPTLHMIQSLQYAVEVAEKKGLLFYPFATYPGKFKPKLSKGSGYHIKQKIFGDKRVDISCRVAGFHHHYDLPKGVFDSEKKEFKVLKKSKLGRSLVSSYNFEIAADPAITLFTQSSPFYQGKYLAKDSRMVVYRGGAKLRYKEGLYSNYQQLGALPPYKHTSTDLLSSLHKRWNRWEKEMKKVTPHLDFNKVYPNKLDISWNPIKINKHGTLEQRGMDVNFLSILVAVTVLLKFSLKKIQRGFIEVIPTDFGIEEPFKLESNILYVPPHTYVRNKLQKWSAYKGYSQKEMYGYAKAFFNFAKSTTPVRYKKIIRPVFDMLSSQKSTSDRILDYTKYKGYLVDNKISNKDASELALYYANKFPKDLDETQKKLEWLMI
ncbi:hypothetical protein GOV08_03025 [Candidatus Woesearchaeota archaeon]|nr:hypothetical protein [Candidatus Woesearchaeota archaeon]